MTNLTGLPSYFWIISSAVLKGPVPDDIEYTSGALQRDLFRVQTAWDDCQASRNRDAIYSYLSSVFNLVAWWDAENRAVERARKVLTLKNIRRYHREEPFAAIIRCTADPAKVDKRTRSKWSRVLRYALEHKSDSASLEQFIKRKGGINECASRYARRCSPKSRDAAKHNIR